MAWPDRAPCLGFSVTRHRHATDWKSVMVEVQFGEKFRAELLELLSWRRDVRHFKPDDLPAGTFERLVQVACLAPSVGLSQPWRFVAVRSQSCRDAIRAC